MFDDSPGNGFRKAADSLCEGLRLIKITDMKSSWDDLKPRVSRRGKELAFLHSKTEVARAVQE